MAGSKRQGGQTVYQIQVTLRGIRRPIWRRFQTLGDISLHTLHQQLQVIMGWTNTHLYRFEIGGTDFGEPHPDYALDGILTEDSRRTKLNKAAPNEHMEFLYEYDFGDGWLHEILVERILPAQPGTKYPVCLAGKRACPPEDCGGIGGYAQLLEVIGDPTHEEHEDMLDWLGGEFDPEEFDLDEVNDKLATVVKGNRPGVRHKVGRDDPCSCGSGKKQKKCCGDAVEALSLPDSRVMERDLRAIEKLVEGKEFDSIEDVNAFIAEAAAKGELPEWKPETPLEQAQELVYRALDAGEKKVRIRLAMDALSISPDCTDAYVLLAEEAAEIPEQARDWYQRGVEAGERVLGRDFFRREAGYFWGIVETRPYMRAREGLAHSLLLLGGHDAAAEHFRDMLRLNPNDNQGIRYSLLSCLMESGDIDGAEELLKQFEGEVSAAWLFTKALVRFIRQGDGPEARQEAKQAIKQNPHVPPYLLGQRALPDAIPNYMELGGESEAVTYLAELGEVWIDTPGAIEWLRGLARGKK